MKNAKKIAQNYFPSTAHGLGKMLLNRKNSPYFLVKQFRFNFISNKNKKYSINSKIIQYIICNLYTNALVQYYIILTLRK